MLRLLRAAVLLALAASIINSTTKGTHAMSLQERGRVRAPELSSHRGWLNTDRPLTLAQLRGKIVLLDFWTYGCINCLHIIPDLKRLEEKYARQLVVIGVHSGKFYNERETDNIRRVVLRYGIEHPVVNDADFKIWDAYAVSAWPTQVLIDPAGYVVGAVAGEGHYDVLDENIGRLVEEFRARGTLNEEPLKLALERAKVGDLPLAFPGKILADAKGARLFISDSNHNRIVITRLDGTLIETIGTGHEGADDGAFDRATFRGPQGLALAGDTLYVADTRNHLVRAVDLKARTVRTVAGTGRQGRRASGARAAPATNLSLSSPWDVHFAGTKGELFIAMAGPHQIWSYRAEAGDVGLFAGSGREARADGEALESGFAQPSGLASDGKTLFVADSESNIIRAIDTESGRVRTLAGGDLFEFGDRDGRGDNARFQHPLGVVFHGGLLYVADTYNHKIRTLDPRTGEVKTFTGTGKPGQQDGARATFYEPAGLSIAAGKLYVADTNNHAVRVVDLATRETSTLKLKGLRPPVQPVEETSGEDSSTGPNAEEFKTAQQRLRADTDAILTVDVALPAGHHVNDAAPNRYKISLATGGEYLALGAKIEKGKGAPQVLSIAGKDLKLPLQIPLRVLTTGAADLNVQLTIYYCREDNTGTCRIKTLAWRVPVEVVADDGAAREIKLSAKVEQ